MGIPKSRSLRTHTPIISSMKFLVILALAVAVSAEADPQLLYPGYTGYTGYTGLPVTSYVQKPLVTSYVHKPVVYTKPVYTKPVEYHAQSAGVSHTVLKREAEPYHHAVPYTYGAMPVTTYTTGYPYMTGFTHGVKTPTYSNDAVTPFNYAAKGQYVANSAGVVHVAKREAEADAQMILPVTTYGHQTLVHPTQSVVYSKPLVYTTPIVQKIQPVNYMAGSYADDSVKPFDYAAKGKYIANSAGTIHKAKREAEAEADPALLYGSGIIPTTYTSGIYNTAGVYNTGVYNAGLYNTHLTYPSVYGHHYGKREAEAEPQYYATAESTTATTVFLPTPTVASGPMAVSTAGPTGKRRQELRVNKLIDEWDLTD